MMEDVSAVIDTLDKEGFHILSATDLGESANRFHNTSGPNQFPFTTVSDINIWSDGFGFDNEIVTRCLNHFDTKTFTSHIHVGRHHDPTGIYTLLISRRKPEALLIYACIPGCEFRIWTKSHRALVKEAPDQSRNEHPQRENHEQPPYLHIDPASLADYCEVKTVTMPFGGRIIMDPRLCFNFVEGFATLFIYRRSPLPNRVMSFSAELEDAFKMRENNGFNIAARFVDSKLK